MLSQKAQFTEKFTRHAMLHTSIKGLFFKEVVSHLVHPCCLLNCKPQDPWKGMARKRPDKDKSKYMLFKKNEVPIEMYCIPAAAWKQDYIGLPER